jgi:hypothetical protein
MYHEQAFGVDYLCSERPCGGSAIMSLHAFTYVSVIGQGPSPESQVKDYSDPLAAALSHPRTLLHSSSLFGQAAPLFLKGGPLIKPHTMDLNRLTQGVPTELGMTHIANVT